jgi:5,6,7,8-tetrahydromethanopterin hydro-lyase
VGDPPGAAHLNTVLGAKGGPVETAWVTALATPRQGHASFVVMHSPGLTVKPLTLFVNKAEIRGDTHARLTWGAAQAGVAQGVIAAMREGSIPVGELDDLLLIAAVWVDWNAADEDVVYENNLESTRLALEAGARGLPSAEDVLAAEEPWSTFFRPKS